MQRKNRVGKLYWELLHAHSISTREELIELIMNDPQLKGHRFKQMSPLTVGQYITYITQRSTYSVNGGRHMRKPHPGVALGMLHATKNDPAMQRLLLEHYGKFDLHLRRLSQEFTSLLENGHQVCLEELLSSKLTCQKENLSNLYHGSIVEQLGTYADLEKRFNVLQHAKPHPAEYRRYAERKEHAEESTETVESIVTTS